MRAVAVDINIARRPCDQRGRGGQASGQRTGHAGDRTTACPAGETRGDHLHVFTKRFIASFVSLRPFGRVEIAFGMTPFFLFDMVICNTCFYRFWCIYCMIHYILFPLALSLLFMVSIY